MVTEEEYVRIKRGHWKWQPGNPHDSQPNKLNITFVRNVSDFHAWHWNLELFADFFLISYVNCDVVNFLSLKCCVLAVSYFCYCFIASTCLECYLWRFSMKTLEKVFVRLMCCSVKLVFYLWSERFIGLSSIWWWDLFAKCVFNFVFENMVV